MPFPSPLIARHIKYTCSRIIFFLLKFQKRNTGPICLFSKAGQSVTISFFFLQICFMAGVLSFRTGHSFHFLLAPCILTSSLVILWRALPDALKLTCPSRVEVSPALGAGQGGRKVTWGFGGGFVLCGGDMTSKSWH